jgi:hypothetical protein
MGPEGAHENWYPHGLPERDHNDTPAWTDVLAAVADRAIGRVFAIELHLDRALSLTLNVMARERIDRAIGEANETITELMAAIFEGRPPPEPSPSKRVVVHPEAWRNLDGRARVAYRARAAQLGVSLELGDTGVPSAEIVLVPDERAEWFPSDGGSRSDNGWEQRIRELLHLD